MTASLAIQLDAEPFEVARSDVAIAHVFEGERPLRGAAGRADWRLCGKLSELVSCGRLTGAAGEAVLVAPRGGLGAPLLIVLGLGTRRQFDADTLEEVAKDAARRSLDLRAQKVALALPSSERTGMSLRQRVHAVVLGVAAAAEEYRAELHLHLVVSDEEAGAAREALRSVRRPTGAGRVAMRLVAADRSRSGAGSQSIGSQVRRNGLISPHSVK